MKHYSTIISLAVLAALLGSGCRSESSSAPLWENYSLSSAKTPITKRGQLARSKCSSENQFVTYTEEAFSPFRYAEENSSRSLGLNKFDRKLLVGKTEASFAQLVSESETAISQTAPAITTEQPSKFSPVRGWYLGINAAYQTIADDELNGTDLLVGTDTIFLPKLDDGTGGGVSLGYRFETMAFEITYIQTQHDADHLGTKFDTNFSSFSLNVREFFRTTSHLQPFVNIGLASTELEIENGATLGLEVGDATLEDEFSLNLGLGCSLYLTPRLSLNLLGEYRFYNNFFEVSGISTKGGSDRISADGVSVIGSLSYTM